MGSADFSRQALLHDGECCIVFAASVRSPRVPTRSFTLIPVPSTVGVPCSYWTLACSAASSTLHSLFGIPVRQASVLPRASFRPTPHGGALASGCILPTAGRIRDFHPLERAPAGRTENENRLRNGDGFCIQRFFLLVFCSFSLTFFCCYVLLSYKHKQGMPNKGVNR